MLQGFTSDCKNTALINQFISIMTVKELISELEIYRDDIEVTVMDILGNDVSPTVAFDPDEGIIHIY